MRRYTREVLTAFADAALRVLREEAATAQEAEAPAASEPGQRSPAQRAAEVAVRPTSRDDRFSPERTAALMARADARLRALDETARAREVLGTDGILASTPAPTIGVGTDVSGAPSGRDVEYNQVLALIARYVREQRTLRSNHNAFIAAAERQYAHQTVDYFAVAPLEHFSTSVRRIELPGGFVIGRLAEVQAAYGLWHALRQVAEPDGDPYAVFGHYREPWTAEHAVGGALLAAARRAVAALRLVMHAEVGVRGVVDQLLTPGAHRWAGNWMPIGPYYPMRTPDLTVGVLQLAGGACRVTDDDVEPLLAAYRALGTASAPGPWRKLDVALRKYNESFSRHNPDDVVLDLSVALESTLLADTPGGMRYRLALRGALLLGGERDPEQTFDLLDALHRARNAIVHEGRTLEELTRERPTLRLVERNPDGWHGDAPHLTFLEMAHALIRDVLWAYVQHAAAGRELLDVNRELERRPLRTGFAPSGE